MQNNSVLGQGSGLVCTVTGEGRTAIRTVTVHVLFLPSPRLHCLLELQVPHDKVYHVFHNSSMGLSEIHSQNLRVGINKKNVF